MVIELNSGNYEKEVLRSSIPVIVDHWALRCGPCMMLAPIFEKLANDAEFKGKLKFAKLDVDSNELISAQNRILNIPCLIIFSKGKEIGRIAAAYPEETLKAKIRSILAKV